MSPKQIPPDALCVEWGKFRFVLSGRAVYLALMLAALLVVVFLVMR